MTNNGKLSEELFEKKILLDDPQGHLYRFEDYAQVNFGRQTTSKIVQSKPADYLLTKHGHTSYVEVKSTIDSRFPFKNIKRGQWRAGTLQTRAGGDYWVYIHFLTAKNWYKVPFRLLLDHPMKSLAEKDIKEFIVEEWSGCVSSKN